MSAVVVTLVTVMETDAVRPVTGASADSAVSEEAEVPGGQTLHSHEDDFSGSSRLPQPGSRPVTSGSSMSSRPRTVASGPMRPVTSRGRVVTSLGSRPGTAMMPDWMFSEEAGGQGDNRPRTGHPRHAVSLVFIFFMFHSFFLIRVHICI